MNWLALAVLSYVVIGCELALRDVLTLGSSGVRPLLVLPLVMFVALHAAPTVALWCGLLLGAATDLLARVPLAGGTDTALVLGPHALGYLTAAYATLLVRGYLIRKNPLSLVFMTIVGGLLSVSVAVGLVSIKNLISRTMVWSTSEQLFARAGSVLVSAFTAFLMAFVLRRLTGVLGLPDATGRRPR